MPKNNIVDTLKKDNATCLHCTEIDCSFRESSDGCPDDEKQVQGELKN